MVCHVALVVVRVLTYYHTEFHTRCIAGSEVAEKSMATYHSASASSNILALIELRRLRLIFDMGHCSWRETRSDILLQKPTLVDKTASQYFRDVMDEGMTPSVLIYLCDSLSLTSSRACHTSNAGNDLPLKL